MSKVICDVCGTSYPDTAAQCPICGCVRTAGKQSVAGDTVQQEQKDEPKREAVKGGRYSKANVRKRSKAAAAVPVTGGSGKKDPQKDHSDRGLVITAWVLVAAIVIVLGYVVIRYFVPNMGKKSDKDTTGSTGESTSQTEDTTQAVQEHKDCVGLTLSATSIVLDAEGNAQLLNVITDPADTDDEIVYASSDETVATVNAQGRVMAIAPGQAVITVTCGNAQATCTVTCDFEAETLPPETTAPEETTAPADDSGDKLELNREDITLAYKGEKWQLYSGSLSKSQITWSTDDASIASINNGEVVAVGSGTTTVYAEYNGQKASCIIRCSFDDSEGGSETATSTEDEGFNTGIGEEGGGEFDDSLAVG